MNIHELLQQELNETENNEGDRNRWLITYADIISLLLGFFMRSAFATKPTVFI